MNTKLAIDVALTSAVAFSLGLGCSRQGPAERSPAHVSSGSQGITNEAPAVAGSGAVTNAYSSWKGPIGALKPIAVYHHGMNLVVAQHAKNGIESGKYLIPLTSSHGVPEDGRIGDGFVIVPASDMPGLFDLGDNLATVYNYRRSQPKD